MEAQNLEQQTQDEMSILLREPVEYCDDNSMFKSSCHAAIQEFVSELCRKPAEVVCSIAIV